MHKLLLEQQVLVACIGSNVCHTMAAMGPKELSDDLR